MGRVWVSLQSSGGPLRGTTGHPRGFALVSLPYRPREEVRASQPGLPVAARASSATTSRMVEAPASASYHPCLVAAKAAARALMENTELDAHAIVERALNIAADICIYTNRNLTIEELNF